jgi:hypothetical protein
LAIINRVTNKMVAKAKLSPLAMGRGNASGFWDFSEAVV